VGKKRLTVEVLLAAAADATPPPLADLLPDPSFSDLLPTDDPWLTKLLALLPRADLDLQDEVQIALHPPLSRVWCRAGRRGQRLVQAPGKNEKRWGFGLVDWRDGWVDWALAEKRAAEPLCAQLRRAVERSKARNRVAIVLFDNLGIHTIRRSKLLRALVEEYREDLLLVYTPAYDPDSNRIEGLWRELRRVVTHNHRREALAELLDDATVWVEALTPAEVLQHIGSPFALPPSSVEDLSSAA
jgi:hypothetical protein